MLLYCDWSNAFLYYLLKSLYFYEQHASLSVLLLKMSLNRIKPAGGDPKCDWVSTTWAQKPSGSQVPSSIPSQLDLYYKSLPRSFPPGFLSLSITQIQKKKGTGLFPFSNIFNKGEKGIIFIQSSKTLISSNLL